MLHGNPLLRGWVLADVSFYTTELPQYMLVELATGLNANVIHVAAGMTYALALVAAAALATGRARGWAAVIGGCIAAGIMLDPQGGDGIAVLLSSPDHIGTSVPMMLAWLILDRTRPGWRAGLAVSLVLGLAGVADSLVTYAAIAPLVLVVAIRLGHALLTDRSTPRRGILAGPAVRDRARGRRGRRHHRRAAGAAAHRRRSAGSARRPRSRRWPRFTSSSATTCRWSGAGC